MSQLPATLPIRIGAALVGKSEPTFRRDILPLVCAPDGRVDRLALETRRGVEFTAEEYIRAEMTLAGRRAREAGYKRASGDERRSSA